MTLTALALTALVAALLILANAFYVASEFSAVSARRSRIERLAADGNRMAAALVPVLEQPERLDTYVAACQIGITASSLALGFYGEDALAPQLSGALEGGTALSALQAETTATVLVLGALTTVQIIVGELVPKAIAVRFPERLALLTAYPMQVSLRLFRPLIALFNGTGVLLLRLVRIRGPQGPAHLHSPEEIALLVTESSRAGQLNQIERKMVHNVFDLSGLVARQVLIPRNRLELADVETPVEALLERLAHSPFSRIPVYRDGPDDIVGIVHLKDLFRLQARGEGQTADIVREVPVVPETLPVGALWQQLNRGGHYLAVVIDEYGGTAGIVTQEDLLEEVIGEVQDEFDVESERVIRSREGVPLVRGDVLVAEVNELLGLRLPTDRADTLGGLVVHQLGRLGEPGDEIELGEVRLRVERVRERWLERVAVLGAVATDEANGDA